MRVQTIIKRMATLLLNYDQVEFIVLNLLRSQGIGKGGSVRLSGETGVFNLISASCPILLDVGGHIGEYTEEFLRVHPRGVAYVFEPSAEPFHVLKARLGNYSNITLVQKGLSDRSGTQPLYKDAEMSGLASLTRRRLEHLNIMMDRVEMVELQTVDEALAEWGVTAIDLLKIDVEGHEIDVLRGASQAFRDNRIKLVQFEFGGCNIDTRTYLKDFFEFFGRYGYTIGIIQPQGRIHWLPKYDEFLEQFQTTNFVAVPPATR